MRVLKPLRASFVHRVFSHQKKHLMVVTVGYCVPFEEPRRPVTEVEMWKMASSDLGRFGVLDHWMYKPQAEVLVTGACYAGESPKTEDYVRLSVGPEGRRLVDKTLYVFGNRHWTLIGPSEPEPFTRMPVDYGHAFGGEKFAPNPVGKGFAALVDDTTGAADHPLPNVEDPKHLMASKGDKGVPASLAPWDPLWPHHFEKKMGSYDRDWVQKNGFALADDADLSLFNVASPDQRVKGYFEGTEELRVEHMHPDKRTLETTLPGFRARCLVRFVEGSKRLVDVPLHLDTLHLFPHRERVVAFFRGLVEVHSTDASDVELCLAAFEDQASDKKSLDEYERVIALRLDKERGPIHSLRDADLMPETADLGPDGLARIGDPIEDVLPHGDKLRKNLHRRAESEYQKAREELVRRGVEPELIPPPPSPPAPRPAGNVDEILSLADQKDQEATAAQSKRRAMEADLNAALGAFCEEHGIDLPTLRAKAKRDNAGPPKFSADAEIERLEQTLIMSRNAGMEIPGLRKRLSDPGLRTTLIEVQQKLHLAYRLGAHEQEPAGAMSEEESARARAELEAVVLGAARERRDFTGAQLAGLDLRGIDLEGVFLEGANLAGANLERAKLRDAVLTRANLEGTNLAFADLERVNLGRAKASGATLEGANLETAILYEADLSNTSLRGARLSHANTLGMRCEGTDFTGIEAEQLVLFKAVLTGAAFRGARVVRSVFMQCEATGIDCARSDFSKTVFLDSKGDGADFSDALADNLRIVMSSFERASFKNARMPGANLREAKLRGASFAGANLRRSLLSGADLREVDASRAILVECLLMDADLTGARLVGANLMLAIMHRAILRGVDASGASLFCADLTGAIGDDKTSFSGSNVKRALVAGVMHG